MSYLVVLLALAAVAAASPSVLLGQLAQPPHHPAIVLDPHGRPLDTAEVIAARSLHLQAKALEHGAWVAPVAHSVVAAPLAYAAAPAAISHQYRHDVHSSPAVLAHSAIAPLSYAHGLHYLKKRSLFGNYLGYSSSPVVHSVVAPSVYAAPAAVSHQSRVDVRTSPAIVAPIAHSVIAAPVAYSPVAYAAPSAVSHQSRVDVHSSPALYAHSVVAPVSYAHGLSHYLKKRSLGHVALYAAPVATSHQSRVDVHSSPAVLAHSVVAAPAVYAAAPALYAAPAPAVYAAPAAVSHQSRVDVHSSPAVIAHSVYAPALRHHSAYPSPLHYSAW